jgi:hypothetical protein
MKVWKKYQIMLPVIILLLAFSAENVFSQGIKSRIWFDSPEMMIGDQIMFHLEVTQPKEAQIFFPEFTDTLISEVEIIGSFSPDTLILEDGQIQITQSYLITGFYAGDYEIRSLPLRFQMGDRADTLSTGFANLKIKSPEIDESKGIYDIKPPIEIPLTVLEVLPWLLLVFWLLTGIYVLYWFIQAFRKQKELEQAIIIETAHEVALREFHKLKKQKLWQSGQEKAYHTRLTDILRKYLENRFGLRAMESTSHEILTSLETVREVDEKNREHMAFVLQTADMVKFAKVIPEPQENEKSMDYAESFVLATKYEEPEQEGTEKPVNHKIEG